jgi:hypothetical protein
MKKNTILSHYFPSELKEIEESKVVEKENNT